MVRAPGTLSGEPRIGAAGRPQDSGAGRPAGLALVTALFFLSGAAGLVYQVLWMRSLGLFLGSDMYGVSIILSTFMGGLALGSLLGGRVAEWTVRPLFWYGAAELGIGLVALGLPALLEALLPWLRSAYPDDPALLGIAYHATRVAVAAATLIVPTTLMGATLPLVLKHFVRSPGVLGALGARFYAMNTLGALVGTLVAGFVLLPYLGTWRATACAAAVNVAIGIGCIALGWRAAPPRPVDVPLEAALDPVPGLDPAARRRIARAALVAFALSGFGSFALEVAWTRILLMSFSATVYSFASTLACFLFGIFVGSRLVARTADSHPNPVGLFAALELGAAASVALVGLLLYAVPGFFGRLLRGFVALLPSLADQALIVTSLFASLPLLVGPTTLLGATFAVALRIYTTSIARVGARSGAIYAANTGGAIAGSLAAGLALIPALGASATIALLALLFLAVGVGLARVTVQPGVRALPARRVAPAAAVTVVCAAAVLALPYRPTLNFDQASLAGAELLHHAEGVQNTIDVVRSPSGATSLVIGGNVEADSSYRQRRHFVLKGHLPLLLAERPASVLVIGLGMGITLQATARHPGLERIDVVELSPDIVAAQAHLAEVNGNVLANPIVRVRIDDGRLYMKLGGGRFDMITADPIHPKVSRVGYLYTREYYESLRNRLNPGGVVCQWMPIYQIAPRRLRSAVKTFLDVFPHATLWYVDGHALLVAADGVPPIDYGRLARKLADPRVRDDLASIGIRSPEGLLSHLLMGPRELRAYVEAEEGVPLNTDDYPYLEYFVPRDLFYTTADNVRALSAHAVDPAELVTHIPPVQAARLSELAAEQAPGRRP